VASLFLSRPSGLVDIVADRIKITAATAGADMSKKQTQAGEFVRMGANGNTRGGNNRHVFASTVMCLAME